MCLIFFLPIIVLIMILVRLDSKGNPIFFQKRVGRNGAVFTIFKIRTLYVKHFGIIAEQNEPSEERITRIGKHLRRSKLDELPQLLNIVLGQMSFVGPRPIAYEYWKLIDAPAERLAVKPGLTGLTQVSGNLQLPWEDRIWLDVWYVRNWAIRLDIKILLLTVLTLIKGEQPHKKNSNCTISCQAGKNDQTEHRRDVGFNEKRRNLHCLG